MVQALVNWFQSCVEQAAERDANFYHSTTSYFTGRRTNIGTEPSSAVYELGLTLPDTVWGHPVVMDLRRLAADMTIYANVGNSCGKSRNRMLWTDVLLIGYAYGQQRAGCW
jgi:hypothetical protein